MPPITANPAATTHANKALILRWRDFAAGVMYRLTATSWDMCTISPRKRRSEALKPHDPTPTPAELEKRLLEPVRRSAAGANTVSFAHLNSLPIALLDKTVVLGKRTTDL